MMLDSSFSHWLTTLTLHAAPRVWQTDLAEECACRDRLILIPTGLGKTEGVLVAWSFHRLYREDDRWPRRLVWCLPMRVLVEQTEQVAQAIAERIPAERRPAVHVLMDVGLATSAQLQAFRGLDCANGKSLRPCHTWWITASLKPGML